MAYDGSIKFDTSLDTKKFNDGINKLKSTATAGFAAVGAAAATGIGGAIKVGMDFEAQMSKVGAISMASAEDMEILRAKAKEMGETTVFSASQAGEAFEYMAMAGWKTEEMTSGIAGIMDLAAASGENLGTVSDIVTDALTAFGLSAQDSGHFANVLAAASSNSNTNVAMMGETFKYVAPLAGSLGYSVEDTAVAIGLMANSGIKAGQAGTSLRSILTRLTKPPKEAATAMKTLGISMQDASGQIKPFNVLMKDMRTAFAKLDKSQRPAFAAMLGGQEAMSGLLAIVNASDKDFDKLTSAIEGAGSAAKEMADRNLDNLKGQLTLAGSAAEGLGIAVYEGIQEPLKNAVKVDAAKISELTASLKGGELQPALQSVGNLLGNVANAVVGLATNAIPPVISAIGSLGNNLKALIPVILGSVIAVKGWAVGKTIAGAISASNTALLAFNGTMEASTAATAFSAMTDAAKTSGITVQNIAVGLLSGQYGILTAAQMLAAKAAAALSAAWAANPVGIVVAGVVALTAAIYAVIKAVNKETEAERAHRESIEKNISAIEDQKKAYENSQKAIYDKANADLAQLGHVQNLAGELDRLVDANGRVKESDQARVNFILGEMNSALGTEYSMINGVIQKYGDLKQSVLDVINSKKLEILMQAQEESYAEAIKNQTKAQQERAQAYANFEPVRQQYESALSTLENLEANHKKAVEDGNNTLANGFAREAAFARMKVDDIKDNYDNLKNAYDEANKNCQNYSRDIEVYQEAATMANAGNVQTAIISRKAK